MFGAVERFGNQPSVPSQDGFWFRHTRYLRQRLASEPFADFGENGPLWIGQTQSGWQLRPQDAVLRSQVLVLKEQFLIDQPGHVCQHSQPLVILHAERLSYPGILTAPNILTLRPMLSRSRSSYSFKPCHAASRRGAGEEILSHGSAPLLSMTWGVRLPFEAIQFLDLDQRDS